MKRGIVAIIVVLTLLLTAGCMNTKYQNKEQPVADSENIQQDTTEPPAELNLEVDSVSNDELEDVDLNINESELENLDF